MFQIVYILDQVRALETEMLSRIKRQGLDVKPRILIVSIYIFTYLSFDNCKFLRTTLNILNCSYGLLVSSFFPKVTRLIPESKGTTCNQRLERVSGTEHTHILRVPFRSDKGILRKWISRFDVWPYLEDYAQVQKS